MTTFVVFNGINDFYSYAVKRLNCHSPWY